MLNVRKIYIDGKGFSICGDLNNNILHYKNNQISKKFSFKKFKIIKTYEIMHKKILNQNFEDVCSFYDGKKILKFINQLR